MKPPRLNATWSPRFFRARISCLITLLLGTAALCRSEGLSDQDLGRIGFEQKLGAQVSLSRIFRDEQSQQIKLGNCFARKPVVLVLGYYGCPMLCPLTSNGMLEAMQDISWSIGKEFEIVQVSIDPHETAELASAKKSAYLKRYGRRGAASGWHFLTGDEPSLRALADEIGFRYAYDSSIKQYAHPSGLVVLSPKGKVVKYLFGVSFSPSELSSALHQAALDRPGTPVQEFILLCFHYNPVKGKFGQLIMRTLRVMSIALLLCITWFWIRNFRRGKDHPTQKPGSSGGTWDGPAPDSAHGS